jgi:biotin carboxyl carrier protein
MSKYRITLEGKTYEMDVELIGEGGAVKPVAKAAPAQPAVSVPAATTAAPAQQANQEVSSGSVVAPMPGTVIKIVKNVGDEVKAGELVLILEAMKMENEISAPVSGKISAINCTAGGTVNGGDVLFEVK